MLVWIDMEMTGLDPETDRVLEIAALVTDSELEIVAEGPSLVVHQSDDVLAGMDEWNTRTHGGSGLTERVRQSTLTDAQAEAQIMASLEEHCPPREAPLAGSVPRGTP